MTAGSLEPHPFRGSRAFTWLWWSQTVSLFGSQVSLVAIPLLAAISLRASPFEMGLLAALETASYLVLSIPAGVLADRVDRRRLLIASNLSRAVLLLLIPGSAAMGILSLPVLYAVAFAVGLFSAVFDVAYQSYVPDVLESHELLGGNQRIELSESAARTAGPGIGGALVGAWGGSVAVVLDAVSYVVASLVLLGASRREPPTASERDTLPSAETSEPRPAASAVTGTTSARRSRLAASQRASYLSQQLEEHGIDAWDYMAALESRLEDLERRLDKYERRAAEGRNGVLAGFGIVLRDRILRDMAASTAIFNLASSAIMAVLILFAARDLGMDPTAIGLLIGSTNIGFVLGALAVGAVTAQLGVGSTLVTSAVLGAIATVLLALAVGPAAILFLVVGRFVGALAIPLFNVNARAFRQSRAPRDALGRVNAVFRFIDWGTLPIGSLLGGWIGTEYGLRATLVIGGVLGTVSAVWLATSPLRHVVGIDHETTAAARAESSAGSVVGALLRQASIFAEGAGRRLAGFGELSLHWSWMAVGGLLLQVALFLPPVSPFGAATPALYVVSCIAVLACVLRNLRIPGFAAVAVGGVSNLLAIVANGGFMPVAPDAARAAGQAPPTNYVTTIEVTHPVLQPLTDIIVVPPPLPLANVYSVGDVLIAIGLALTFLWTVRKSPGPPAAGPGAGSGGGRRQRRLERPSVWTRGADGAVLHIDPSDDAAAPEVRLVSTTGPRYVPLPGEVFARQ